ncbi:NADPH-dependent pterin aldehyde reductase-like [Cucurbita pepo subsp. pepo]|uniref:NADPH-dependent pterin aldehyde reductase-like n=1 Tax=Cucurbita pepo subsp. pepo TaxID=3664 RepID=UPI000C9D29C7|nr:NADPH-dependent pterin aldehyde reductase-like [Cucurbita pepo subsp. pepo]
MATCLMQQKGSGEEANGGKKIVITGVSQGLGRALAFELAKRGHTIIGCSRTQDKLDSLHQQLSNSSSLNHLLLNVDVRSDESVETMVRTVIHKFGVPDIIVNNAATINKENAKIGDISREEFDDIIDTNVKGTANVLRHFIPLMIPRNQGIIVNISSLFGRMGAPLVSPYCSSKWAVEGLSKSVAKELPNGMTVVALDPGLIYTEMLLCSLGKVASNYQSPQEWASKAASMILNFTNADNGASLTVEDPGTLPT